MGTLEAIEPATNIFVGGFSSLLSYAWVLLVFVALFFIGGIAWWVRMIRNKKGQWTHRLKVRRVLDDNRLSDPIYHNMRRFPLIKKAEVFELETPLLGSYLLPELDEYSGLNEFSIILDKNNRIYTNKGEFFNKDRSCVNVSAKHSEIDIQRQNLKADWQNINKISKRIEWSTIAKYAFLIVGIACVTIILIVAIQKWGEAQKYKADEAKAMKEAMESLEKAMTTVDATVNTQKLEILPLLQELYKTKNLSPIINQEIYNVSSS